MKDNTYFSKDRHRYLCYKNSLFSNFIFSRIVKETSSGLTRCSVAFELGAGMGRFSYAIIKNFPCVYLIEPSHHYASLLGDIFKDKHVKIFNITAQEFFAKNMIPRDAACFSFHLLHHLQPNQRATVFNFIKKNDCQAVFIEPNPWNPLVLIHIFLNFGMRLKEEIGYLKLTKNNIAKELGLHGLAIRSYSRICFLPPFLTNWILNSFLARIVYLFEKLNNLATFFGSYQLIYCTSRNK
jgi:hypothetical protein